jgi:hypothetical protein
MTASVPQPSNAATELASANVSPGSQVNSLSTLLTSQAPSPRADGHRQGSPGPLLCCSKAGQLPRGPTALPQPHQAHMQPRFGLLRLEAMLPQRLRPGLQRPHQRYHFLGAGWCLPSPTPSSEISFQLNKISKMLSQKPLRPMAKAEEVY